MPCQKRRLSPSAGAHAHDLTDAALGEILADIVEAAGREILPLWRSGLGVDFKSDESPVTEADRRGETADPGRAGRAPSPDVPVISEEDASEFGTPDEIGPRFFLVDPLDGTKAFVRGDEHLTVNIGLIENGVRSPAPSPPRPGTAPG